MNTKIKKGRISLLLDYLRSLSASDIIGIGATLLIIFVAEYMFLKGNTTEALFIGLWAPTFIGFLNFFKIHNISK
ncbi:MAG: hypothetical protein AAF824_14075 [Bacteroidota bacterium]